MSSTVLFSAVDDVAARHPLFVSEVRAFFLQHGLAVGTPVVVAQLAGRLDSTEFTEDLVSMLRVVCADEPSISYLELLGLLLAAAGVDPNDAPLRDASEGDARHLFNFLVERRRIMKADLEAVPFTEGAALEEAPSFSVGEPSSTSFGSSREDHANLGPTAIDPRQTDGTTWLSGASLDPRVGTATMLPEKANAALARALALSADEAPLPLNPSLVDASAAQGNAATTAASAPPAASTLLNAPAPGAASAGYRTWLVGACGVVLGLLLGLFLHRRSSSTPVVPPSLPSATDSATTDPAATDPAAAATKPAHRLRGVRPSPAVAVAASTPSHTFRQPASRSTGAPQPHARNTRGPATPMTSGTPRGSTAAALSPRPAAGWAGLGNTPSAALQPGAVREVRLDPPRDLSSSSRPASRPRVFVGSAGIMAANLISSPSPVYPAQANAAHVQGEVVIEAIVGRDGSVTETRVISGPPLLRQAALNAVGRWRYRPYEVDGEASEIATTARLSFQLDGQ